MELESNRLERRWLGNKGTSSASEGHFSSRLALSAPDDSLRLGARQSGVSSHERPVCLTPSLPP
jgi:hypothetical protein